MINVFNLPFLWLLLLRGENGPTCYALAPIPGDPEKCLFRWILDTDLKVR